MYWWRPVIPQIPAPSPRPYKNLQGIKSICTVWIRPTEHFITHPNTSFGINGLWYNKYDTHKSKINKRILEQITWRMFYIKQSNKLKRTSLNTQPATSKRPYKNCGESKSVRPVWIHPTDNFLTHPRTSFIINERWSDQCKQTDWQSMAQMWQLKPQIKILDE